MDINEILKGARKKGRDSRNDYDSYSQESEQNTSMEESASSTSSDENTNFLAKEGEPSSVEITNPSYNYDEDNLCVEFSMDRLDNASQWTTGDIKVFCWISEYRYNFEDGFGNNHFCVGDYNLGHLDKGYGFPDVKREFKLKDDVENIDIRWHFVFTINEYNSDGNWYIIDYRNGECHLCDDDFEAIMDIICDKLNVDSDDVHYDSSFVNDLGADSLDAVELIMEFEKKFGINIPDEDAENIRKVSDIVEYLCNVL